ncbi:MAG: hypothetical protein GEU68_00065 [Actinobacteria bacterium]|nr:hypothetical protein [Actinomycetota bacterium]
MTDGENRGTQDVGPDREWGGGRRGDRAPAARCGRPLRGQLRTGQREGPARAPEGDLSSPRGDDAQVEGDRRRLRRTEGRRRRFGRGLRGLHRTSPRGSQRGQDLLRDERRGSCRGPRPGHRSRTAGQGRHAVQGRVAASDPAQRLRLVDRFHDRHLGRLRPDRSRRAAGGPGAARLPSRSQGDAEGGGAPLGGCCCRLRLGALRATNPLPVRGFFSGGLAAIRKRQRDADTHLMSSVAGHFAKRQLIERRRDFLRKHWWRLAIIVGMLTVVGVGLHWVFPTAQIPVWAAVPSLFLALLFFGRELFDGTYHLVNALEAEGWTSKDLRRWLGRDWHVVDWISFEFHDVDHVVVGPGGVLAVETKWTDSKLDLRSSRGKTRAHEWIQQATNGSRSVQYLLSSFGYRLRVSPVVVVWGPEISGVPLESEVPVLRPKEMKSHASVWRNSSSNLSREQIDDIRARLLEYREMREKHELGLQ